MNESEKQKVEQSGLSLYDEGGKKLRKCVECKEFFYAWDTQVVNSVKCSIDCDKRYIVNDVDDFTRIGDDKMTEKELHENQDAELEAERQSAGYYDPYVSKYGTEYKQMKDAY